MDFSNWSKPNENWGAGAIEVDEMVASLKTVAKNSLGPVAVALGILWLARVVLDVVAIVLQTVGHLAPAAAGLTGILASVVAVLTLALAVFIGLASYALYRPLQLQAFEGKAFVTNGIEALKLAREVLGKTVVTGLLFGASLLAGSLACGVGVLIPLFFFVQAPYLAATTELSPMECMRRSYELNKSYAAVIAMTLAVSLVSVGVLAGCGGAIVGVLVGVLVAVFPPAGSAVGLLGVDVLGFLGGLLVLVITGAAFTAIQSTERGVPLHS